MPEINDKLDDYGNVDYSKLIREEMSKGNEADVGQVNNLLRSREYKSANTPGYEKYIQDDFYHEVVSWIDQNTPKQNNSYAGAPAPEWTGSQYSASIDAVINQILNRQPFSYDAASDPMYQQYARQYQREGERSMQDVLAEVAGNTGGLASSYATTAASQARDYYGAKLADVIPQLQQLAYEKHMGEQDAKARDLGLLQSLDESLYGRYRDAVGDWQVDRSFNYGVGRDQRDDARYAEETAYNRGVYADETAYNREQDAKKEAQMALDQAYRENTTAFNQAITRWEMTGRLDAEGAKVLGLPEGTLTSDYRFRQAQAASGGGSGGSTEYKPKMTLAQIKEEIAAGNLTPTVLSDYAYYYGAPYSEAPNSEPDGQTSRNYQSVLSKLSVIEDKGYSEAAKAKNMIDTIEAAYNAGSINAAEANKLLAQYGLA